MLFWVCTIHLKPFSLVYRWRQISISSIFRFPSHWSFSKLLLWHDLESLHLPTHLWSSAPSFLVTFGPQHHLPCSPLVLNIILPGHLLLQILKCSSSPQLTNISLLLCLNMWGNGNWWNPWSVHSCSCFWCTLSIPMVVFKPIGPVQGGDKETRHFLSIPLKSRLG